MATVQTEPLYLHGRTFSAPGPVSAGYLARFIHHHLGRLPSSCWEAVLTLESAGYVPHDEARSITESILPSAWKIARCSDDLARDYTRARCRFVREVDSRMVLAAERYPVLLPGGILSLRSMKALLRTTAKAEGKPEQEVLASDPLLSELIALDDDDRADLVEGGDGPRFHL